MAISSISTNYGGRTRDLFISQNITPYNKGPQVVEYNFGKLSSSVVGVQKLVQRYVISLFNTGLATALESARSSNIQEATHIFNFASWEVIQAFKEYQKQHPEMPEDEQLETAQLTNIAVTPGKISLAVNLITRAGATVEYILPVTLT